MKHIEIKDIPGAVKLTPMEMNDLQIKVTGTHAVFVSDITDTSATPAAASKHRK